MALIASPESALDIIPGPSFTDRAQEARIAFMRHASDFQLMPFSQAFDVWLEIHREEIRERTYKDYLFYGRNLKRFFEGTPLSHIHIGHILEYRKQRKAGAEIINHEIATVKQILKMAGLWDLIAKYYRPMRRPTWTPPKVLTADQEEKFFRVVSDPRRKEWQVAYQAVSLSNNTSAICSELRFLQIQHLLLDHNPPKIHIDDKRAKNEFRGRRIPLNAIALKQVKRLLARAEDLAYAQIGTLKPEHYLFPFRVKKGKFDVTRPASPWFIRSAFRSMRKVLGPDFEWLNPRNFRNQLFTKLFEAGAPDQVIIDIGGHSAIKMSREYSRIRMDAKYDALKKIEPKGVGRKSEVEDAS